MRFLLKKQLEWFLKYEWQNSLQLIRLIRANYRWKTLSREAVVSTDAFSMLYEVWKIALCDCVCLPSAASALLCACFSIFSILSITSMWCQHYWLLSTVTLKNYNNSHNRERQMQINTQKKKLVVWLPGAPASHIFIFLWHKILYTLNLQGVKFSLRSTEFCLLSSAYHSNNGCYRKHMFKSPKSIRKVNFRM